MKSISNVDIHDVVKLKEFGYKSVDVCSPYEVLRLSCDEPKAVIILFSSGKLLVQTSKDNERNVVSQLNKVGINANADELIVKKEQAEKTEDKDDGKLKHVSKSLLHSNMHPKNEESILKKEELKKEETVREVYKSYHSIIGSDESLKGDTFGGIVVAAVFADDKIRKKLIKLKVCDSKLLTDDAIRRMAPEIMNVAPYHVENMYPQDYNKYEVTPLLNRLHRVCFEKVIDLLKTLSLDDKSMNNVKHVVDKYPGCKTGDIITEKAESKYIEVAAASIVARYYAIMQIEDLSRKAGFLLPFGSTHVDSALKRLKQSDLDPNEFVKFKFSNVRTFFRL